jgi:V8-like Glu-specific endopeptidase
MRPALEPMEERALLSLTPVPANAGFPYSAIVELQATFPDQQTYDGSGVMVDSFHVLTAGHLVYSSADGGLATSILAVPDLSGSSAPFGSARMTNERTFQAFVRYDRSHPGTTAPGDYDIALITLDRPIGDLTGWMAYGYDNRNADFAPGTAYSTAGYPGTGADPATGRTYDGTEMESSSGAVAGLSPDGSTLAYYQSSITTYPGQSGSPVWRSSTQVVYGVHVGKIGNGDPSSLNFATRITRPIFKALQSWRASDAGPRHSVRSAARIGGGTLALRVNPARTHAERYLPYPAIVRTGSNGSV